MAFKSLIGAACAGLVLVSFSANAALIGRLETSPGSGAFQAYYDTDYNLTWTTDSQAIPGRAYQERAIARVSAYEVDGVNGWRLPTVNEFDDLYHMTLGNPGGGGNEVNVGPFQNVYLSGGNVAHYWTSDVWDYNPVYSLAFSWWSGGDVNHVRGANLNHWAVQSGDVSPVPLPAAAWLFISAIAGLAGAKRLSRSKGSA